MRGVGRAGGFAMVIEDRGDAGMVALQEQTENLMRVAGEQPRTGRRVHRLRDESADAQGRARPARVQWKKGSTCATSPTRCRFIRARCYVNDFNLFGRTWQVIVQAEQQFRDQVEDLHKLKVRNASGAMVPLGSLARFARSTARWC